MTKMETMKKAPRLANKEDKGKKALDADLWGKLQDHIPLQTIYEKLSQQHLLRLRLVNKEWNHAALQWTLPKPSFVIIGERNPYVVSPNKGVQFKIFTYNSVSGKFEVNHQRFRLHLADVEPYEVEGLILCRNPNDVFQRGVFNVHTQAWHAIPTGPGQSGCFSLCGLLVDTTVKPYTFKLIEGNKNFKTQIYDSKSRSWSRRSSLLPPAYAKYVSCSYRYSCVCHNNNVYTGTRTIGKYSLEDDKWTNLEYPNYPVLGNSLGVWAGRIFTTGNNHDKQRVTVWELVDPEAQVWVEYAGMPKEHYKWLRKRDCGGFGISEESPLRSFRSFFRDGYLLVSFCGDHAYVHYSDHAYVHVLFDLATKVWQIVEQKLESFQVVLS